MPKFLRSAYFSLLVALPTVLFFSYYPIISFGANSSMNFELSLPLIWLVLFDLISFTNLVILFREYKNSAARPKAEKNRGGGFIRVFLEHGDLGQRPGASSRNILIKLLLLLLFPLWAALSIFWSSNPLRATLTAGILWLLIFAIFAIIRLSPLLNLPSRLKIWAIRAFFISAALICLFCFIQSLLDSCGLSRETTLLCAGCTYRSFGFPHPNGFAIEPQFMGNLLLAPTLLALYLLTKTAHHPSKTEQIQKTEHVEPEHNTLTFPQLRKTLTNSALVACAILFSTTLFFTFSRGAIYSYALGLLILIIFALCRHIFRPALIIIPVATFLLSLGLQGAFAHFGPTSETFTSAVTKSIHQLSLGLIDLRPTTQTEPATSGASDNLPTPAFNGYVSESTSVRLGLSSTALATWSQNPGTIIFGVGLGGSGIAMHQFDSISNPSPKEIVQNQPVSLLLETGLFGIAFLLLALYLTFRPGSLENSKTSPFWTHPALPLLTALIVAYLLSMQFFAGLPNALHIYLLLPLFYYLFLPNTPKNVKTPKNSTKSLPKLQNKHKHS